MLQTKHPDCCKEHETKRVSPTITRLSDVERQALIRDYRRYRERLTQSYTGISNEQTVENYGNSSAREYPRGIAGQPA